MGTGVENTGTEKEQGTRQGLRNKGRNLERRQEQGTRQGNLRIKNQDDHVFHCETHSQAERDRDTRSMEAQGKKKTVVLVSGQDNREEAFFKETMNSSLQLKFITNQSSGLLFLAIGGTQFLMVDLINGTLRTRLNRGSGESELKTPTWLTLNNLKPHKINLVITESNITLTLDNFTTSSDLPRTAKQMNMKDGIYLGGTGTSDIPFIPGDIFRFRGCIWEAKFDNLDLFSYYDPLVHFHGQWDYCHLGTTESSQSSFGFLGLRSYLMFPSWDISSHGTIHLILETSRPGRAPLLYQSGPQKSYFYVEISGGHLKGTLNTGESAVTIENPVYISDNRPHSINISVDKSEIQFGVDKTFSKISIDGHGHVWDFHGNMYLGGVDASALTMMKEGPLGELYFDDVEYRSFTGCLKDLTVNSIKLSFHDVLKFTDVATGCQEDEYGDYVEYDETSTQYYTSTTMPGSTPTHPLSSIISSLYANCKLESMFPNMTKLLSPQSLTVIRGGSLILDLEKIHPIVDFGKVGISQSQVIFKEVGSTQHGRLIFDIPGAEVRKTFTLLDVTNHKVQYVHDGSESNEDALNFEVDISSRETTSDCLRKKQRYRIPIKVSSKSSAPILLFPKGKTFRILSHRQKIITNEIIQIEDYDTPCDELTIIVSGSYTEGHIERQNKPGEAVHEFSCRDLENGHVAFIHKSGNQLELTLQASDGSLKSDPALISLLVMELNLQIAQIPQLEVSQGASILIPPSSLPSVSNADTFGLEVFYHISENPKFGEVQKLMVGDEWKVTKVFKENDLEKRAVRYFSKVLDILQEELHENLSIQMYLGAEHLSNETLQVKVKKPYFHLKKMIPLKLGRKREVKITGKEIQMDIGEQGLRESLTYFIMQSPKKGNLQINGQRLIEGSQFKQDDIQKQRLSYVASVRNTRDTDDQFQFQVITDTQKSPIYTFKIQIGVDPDAPYFTNHALHVLEGGEEAITPEHLFLTSGNSASFFYEVIDGPQHGVLIRKGNTRVSDPAEVGVTEFTNDDILLGQLFYQHDGSETTEDDIPFVASMLKGGSGTDSSGEEDETAEKVVVRGVFRVSIQPVNDNPPFQIVHKVFYVVSDGQRLLTTNDIAFSDPDSGSTDAQIVLVRHGVPFGKIAFVDDPSLLVFQFTQEDLRRHRILYVHSGPDQGSIQLQVSDGLHHLTTILEVQASEPFIRIANITMLNVSLGGQVTLKTIGLQLETNLDVRIENIRYYIEPQPRRGVILKEGKPANSFRQHELVEGKIIYHHNGERNNKDRFGISVDANHVVTAGEIEIHVVTDTLRVIRNEKVYVFQGERTEIKKEDLMISAEGKLPQITVYTLTYPPSFGYLVAIGSELSSDGSPSLDTVETFTQEDINQGKILYLHSAPDLLPDSLTLEVTTGEGVPQEVVVPVEVLPINIPLIASDLEVKEGGKAALSNSTLQISSKYFLNLDLEFTVLIAPSRGHIVSAKRVNLRSFNWNKVNQGQVFYEHDGSETLSDNFTIAVFASDINRQSRPTTISVTVQSINDEKPVVVTNTGMQVMEGTTAELSSQVLYSTDADSSPDELIYSCLPPSNGQLILRGSTGQVVSFTQQQLDQGDVHFVQKGNLDGGFYFNVSDGINQSDGHFFHIQVIPLAITMETLQDLTVCPRSPQPITSQHLQAVSNEPKDIMSDLLYHIDEPPQHGDIVRQDRAVTGLMNFTQSEIDAGIIYYKHSAMETPFWTAQDSFSFHVTSHQVVSKRFLMNVTVSFQGLCPQLHTRLWKNTGITVMEGSSSSITSSHLDASNLLANTSSYSQDVFYFLTTLPSWGYLAIEDVPLEQHSPQFLQSQLEKGKLQYIHTGPGILADSFHFKAWLLPKSRSFSKPPEEVGSLVISESFNVTVIGVPKLPLQLSPPKLQLQVAPGSYAVLTHDHLSIDVPLIPSEKIIYTVLEMPEGISLATQSNQYTDVFSFTQEDVNMRILIILANRTAASGSIQFNITTRNQSPLVALLPVKVSPLHKSILEVPQASAMATLTTKHITPTKESVPQDILFKITKQPSFGQLMAKQMPVREFWWAQVKNGEVSYVFTRFLSSQDEFEYLALSNGTYEMAGTVTVAAIAMVKLGDREQWPRGCTVMLGPDTVSASELGTHTKSDPEFRVLHLPNGARLVKYPKEKGEGESTSIDYFTQSEIERGLIGVEIWDDGYNGLRNDRIQLEVAAKNAPPANVRVKFSTIPYNASQTYIVKILRKSLGLDGISTLAFTTSPEPTSVFKTTDTDFTINLQHTTYTDSSTKQFTTNRPLTNINQETVTSPLFTTNLMSVSSQGQPLATTDLASFTSQNQIQNVTKLNSMIPNLWTSLEDVTITTSQSVVLNSSWHTDMSNKTMADEVTLLGFLGAHTYSIVLPACLVLFLIVTGLLILFSILWKKQMGKHHVQKAALSSGKPENGVNDHQSFQPTETDRAIPLTEVGTGLKGNGAGGQGSHYWV
ncbi:chondroitin sulfate proteoglycan 4 [Xenopus laevis]|uniref:Chondroitin sulfate proteoglycan 4 n=1 Tax=Xenopus laevis TaxID=8355 RepID=A0A8J1MPM7_XENLA|nr:chondroitin sulfate proteoglycan 4 [Xenopus laevis]